MLNEALAAELGLDAEALRAPDAVAVFAGNATPEGVTPVAQAYAGHQFGGFSPRLGDGRALLLGEVHDVHGRRRDVQLKGSGRKLADRVVRKTLKTSLKSLEDEVDAYASARSKF